MNGITQAYDLKYIITKISIDTGIKYEFASTQGLKDIGYNVSDERVINGLNTKEKILINIDSNKTLNRVFGHETTHLLENTEDYQTLQNVVLEYAKTKGEYDSRKAELEKTYKGIEANIDNELTADLVGDYLFDDIKFVEHLSKNKNIFQKIYDKIKYLYKIATAGSKEKRQLEKVKHTFEKMYEKNKVKSSNEVKYSIQKDSKGNKYVNIDTDQDIFKNKTLAEQNKIAKRYILDNFRESGININNENVKVTSRTANEYTHPKKELNRSDMSAKLKASTELNNLLSISEYKHSRPDDGRHGIAKDGWDYYKTNFRVGNQNFDGLINIAKNGNIKTLYDITNIKKTPLVGLDEKSSSATRTTSFSKNNVS